MTSAHTMKLGILSRAPGRTAQNDWLQLQKSEGTRSGSSTRSGSPSIYLVKNPSFSIEENRSPPTTPYCLGSAHRSRSLAWQLCASSSR